MAMGELYNHIVHEPKTINHLMKENKVKFLIIGKGTPQRYTVEMNEETIYSSESLRDCELFVAQVKAAMLIFHQACVRVIA